MSQTTEVLQQELRDNLIVSYEEYSLLCLVVYEFIVTLDEELTVVWRRRPTATSMLLLIMRWIMLLGPIVQTVPARPTWCRSQYAWNIAVFLVTTAVIALFSALRVYALWQGSRLRHLLAGIVFVFGAVPVATNIFAATHASGFSYDPVFSACEVRINVSPELNAKLLFVTRGSAILSDVLALVLTWIKSYSQFKEMRRLGLGSSVSTVLLRDGTLYFLALLAINILQLMTFFDTFSQGAYAVDFLQSLPPLLVQRFMLNLRQLDRTASENNSDADHFSRFSISFRVPSDFLGNIGQPLEHSHLSDGLDEDIPHQGQELSLPWSFCEETCSYLHPKDDTGRTAVDLVPASPTNQSARGSAYGGGFPVRIPEDQEQEIIATAKPGSE